MQVTAAEWFALFAPEDDQAGPETYEPIVFEVELETYLAGALAVPVWPGNLPAGLTQKNLPALVYNLVSSSDSETLDGPDSVSQWLFQFDAYAPTRLKAATLIEQLKAKLWGYRGPMGAATVLNVARENQSHGPFEPMPDKSGFPTHRRMAEYRIWWREPVPSFTDAD